MNERTIAKTGLALAGAAALGLLFCGCAAMSYLGYWIAPDYPADESETVDLPGLGAPVTVYLDALGVAHVDAASEEDLLRAVGWVHGRERFFQMDALRRFARGRLSELVGEQEMQFGDSVQLDATMRGWGFERLAEQDARSLDPDDRKRMQAFAAGVNAALARHEPVEYRLLGVEPEPWKMADSFALGRLVGWSVTHNWHQELSRLVIAVHAGLDRAERIYPNEPWPGRTSHEAGGAARDLLPAVAPELREIFKGRAALPGLPGEPVAARGPAARLAAFGAASNAWVLGGARTASGKPILANDPHMSHTLPSLMFQQHLRSPGLDVIGTTAPGLPYVLIGHNRKVAWGMTSAVADVIDLYVEKADPADPARVLGPAGPEPLRTETMVVRVRDGDEMLERRFALRSTPRGPLVNDLYPGLLPARAPLVSLRWDSEGAGASIGSLSRANRAGNVAELRRALLGMVSPVNSVMAADTGGTIALFPTGRLPKRRGHRGTFPAPAWLAAYDWDGRVPPEDMPLFTAGADGFFAHGNNLMYDPARGDVFLHVDSAPSYRLDRIVEMIAVKQTHTVADMRRMQADVVLLRARLLLGHIIADLEDLEGLRGYLPREEPALRLLRSWDHAARSDSPAAAVFFLTFRQAIIAAMADEVDEPGLSYLLSQRYFTNAADLWFVDPDHPVWDDRATGPIEKRAHVVRAAFRWAVQFLRETQGSEPRAWRWGALHDLQARHALGSKIEAFNLPRIEASGGPDSVWKSHIDLGNEKHPFRVVAGPVFRMIVDLADMDHGLWIIDTGASGWPGSPHYADQFELWRKGEYAPMLMDWDEIKRTARAVIKLRQPAFEP